MTDQKTQDENLSIKTVKDPTSIPVNKQNKARSNNPELVNNYKYVPSEYKDVAKGMEKQFAEFMIQQMENSVGSTSNNSAAKYYKSLMNSERANVMATKDQGLGLQKVILDQIYPQHMRNPATYKQFLAQKDARIIKRNNIEMTKPQLEGKEPGNE